MDKINKTLSKIFHWFKNLGLKIKTYYRKKVFHRYDNQRLSMINSLIAPLIIFMFLVFVYNEIEVLTIASLILGIIVMAIQYYNANILKSKYKGVGTSSNHKFLSFLDKFQMATIILSFVMVIVFYFNA